MPYTETNSNLLIPFIVNTGLTESQLTSFPDRLVLGVGMIIPKNCVYEPNRYSMMLPKEKII